MGLYNRIAEYIWLYVVPVLSGFGIACNGLSITVALQPKVRKKNFGLLMVVLGVVDSGILIFGATAPRLIRFSSRAGCKAYSYTYAVLTLLQPWILVQLTLERLVAVWRPVKVKIWFSRRRVIVGLVISILLSMLLPSPVLLFAGNTSPEVCSPDPEADGIGYFRLLLIILFSIYIPFLLLMITGSYVAYYIVFKSSPVPAGDVSERRNRANAISLTTVPILFVILVAPFAAIFLYAVLTDETGIVFFNAGGHDLWLLGTLCEVLIYVNSSINLFLYGLRGTLFREELNSLSRKWKSACMAGAARCIVCARTQEEPGSVGPPSVIDINLSSIPRD